MLRPNWEQHPTYSGTFIFSRHTARTRILPYQSNSGCHIPVGGQLHLRLVHTEHDGIINPFDQPGVEAYKRICLHFLANQDLKTEKKNWKNVFYNRKQNNKEMRKRISLFTSYFRRGKIMKTAVLFDLDGTLTDSAPGIIDTLKYALNKQNIIPPDDLQFVFRPLLLWIHL